MVRPAIARDRWQIHLLLQHFNWEATPGKSWTSSWVKYAGLALLALLGFHGLPRLGMDILVPVMGLLCIGGFTFLLSILFSKEWQKFWVIEQAGQIVACAKLCRYPTYSVLYSVVVSPALRQQGMGSGLVYQVSQAATRPLYLACFPVRLGFYTRLGFVRVRSQDLSPMLQYELGLTSQPDIIPLVLR